MGVIWVAFIVGFVVLDLYAVFTGSLTFSHFVWQIEAGFPRIRFVTAFVLGLVVSHFWWGSSR